MSPEERWSNWWFLNGGGIYRAFKYKQWTELRGLADMLPKLAWDKQQKEIDRLTSLLALHERVAEAAGSLVAEWRAMPKFADDIWQRRQDVVLAFDALRAAQKEETT